MDNVKQMTELQINMMINSSSEINWSYPKELIKESSSADIVFSY